MTSVAAVPSGQALVLALENVGADDLLFLAEQRC